MLYIVILFRFAVEKDNATLSKNRKTLCRPEGWASERHKVPRKKNEPLRQRTATRQQSGMQLVLLGVAEFNKNR